MVNSLIDSTMKAIAKKYQPGTLAWMKANRLAGWVEMVSLEEKINQMALKSDMEGLKKTLLDYKGLILSTVMERKSYDK